MAQIMAGEASPAQIAGFLIGLRAKGESVEEMHGLADADARPRASDRGARAEPRHRRHGRRPGPHGQHLDDVRDGRGRRRRPARQARQPVGVLVVRVCRRPRGARGRPVAAARAGRRDRHEAGITFCFAADLPPVVPSHRRARGASSAIGTAFNFLGPADQPGAADLCRPIGCADARMAPLVGRRFAGRGKDAAVFRGDDGLDEVTVSTTTRVWWVRATADHGARGRPDAARARAASRSRACVAGMPSHNAGRRARRVRRRRRARFATRCSSTRASPWP